MSNDKQSSIDFLLKELEEIGVLNIKNCDWSDEVDVKKAIEQAKAMRKHEIMQSLNDGKAMALCVIENLSLEQYYNETYESNS